MSQEITSGKEKILVTLKKCKLFSELPDEVLRSVAELGSIEEYGAGEDIYEQGSLGDKLYILSQGEVALYRRMDLMDKRPGMATVYVAKESPHRRLLGGWCTLVGEKHLQMCTARCVRPSKVVSIGCMALRETLGKSPEFHVRILEKLVLILRDRIESSYAAMETL